MRRSEEYLGREIIVLKRLKQFDLSNLEIVRLCIQRKGEGKFQFAVQLEMPWGNFNIGWTQTLEEAKLRLKKYAEALKKGKAKIVLGDPGEGGGISVRLK